MATLYMTMKAFTDGLSHASFLPRVGQEIKKFLEIKADLVEKHDPRMFLYLKALQLGHD